MTGFPRFLVQVGKPGLRKKQASAGWKALSRAVSQLHRWLMLTVLMGGVAGLAWAADHAPSLGLEWLLAREPAEYSGPDRPAHGNDSIVAPAIKVRPWHAALRRLARSADEALARDGEPLDLSALK